MNARLREPAILSGYLAAALVLTLPLAPRFLTEIGGDYGDHWQTVWGMWWVKTALVDLHQSPFFSTQVHWPIGMSLVFETFDLPDCLLAIPLWGFLPPIAVFNTVELWSYPLGGYFFYRFALELLRSEGVAAEAPGRQRTAAVIAGALFTFAPYHFGHALGHMHLVALQWVPAYFWLLLLSLNHTERRYPLLAALALAAASTASWYYLLFCVVLTGPYLAYRAAADPRVRRWPVVRQALLLGASFLALLWPLFSAMLAARAAEPWDGAHNPDTFSADLYEFFVPNAAQAVGHFFGQYNGRWSGNPAENCDYLGYGLLALAAVGVVRSRGARPWLAIALIGLTLALGPHLHVAGQVGNTLLPYGWLEQHLSLLAFTGCPVRAGFVAVYALAAAAAFGLAALLATRTGAAAAAVLLLISALEFWPHPFTTSRMAAPAIFESWAKDRSTFGVYDSSGDTRPLWNGVLHQHPMVDIYLSRTPLRLLAWLDQHPVIGRLRHPGGGPPLDLVQGRQLLREQRIRYFVLPQWRRDATLERDLQLPMIYEGEGLRVYEVPASD